MTSYSQPYPIQIYISNYVLHYVFASGITLLNSFLEFETLIKKWCQCDLLLTVIFYSKSHFKSCLHYVFASGSTLLHLFWETYFFETLIKNYVSVTSYWQPYPIQICILNHVLYYVIASGLTLLHSFWKFDTLFILILANVSHICRWCQCDTKHITCLFSSISWEWI